MSILSVDNISPIGSGTSVTINNAATLVLNNLSVSGVSTFSTANSTIGAIIKNTAHDSQLQILATYSNKNSVIFFGDAADDDIGQIDYDHNDNSLAFVVNTSEALRITSAGNIGVNVTSPDRKLHVGGSFIRVDDGYGLDSSGSTEKVVLDNGFIALTTNSNERLRIDSAGRFLKGLTSAGASRSSTSVRYPHFQLSSPWSSGLGSYKIECTDDYPIIFLDSNASYADGTGAGVVTWSVKDSSGDYCNTASIRSKIDGTPSNDNAPGRLEFMTTTSGSTSTTKMTIDSGGSVSKPLNPAFYAYLTTNNAVYSAGTIIPWTNTSIDTRSAFATSGSDIGRYTVPTTGIYYFGWRLNRRDDSRFDIAIYQNGSIKYIDELRWAGTSNMWMAESGHYVLSCTAGHKVDLRVFAVTNAGSGQFDGGGNGYYDGFFGWMIG